MGNTTKIIFFTFLLNSIFLSFASQASQRINNVEYTRTIPIDKRAPQGFSYTFKERIIYHPYYNSYIVGQHCYRGDPIRFDIPREEFIFYIDGKKYKPPYGGGRSVWHKFFKGAKLNFLLMWIDSAYSVVELEQDACADVVLDTRYHLEEKLKQATNRNVKVVVYDSLKNKVGEFTLTITK